MLVGDVLVVTAPLGGHAPPSSGGGGVGGGVLAIANDCCDCCAKRTDLVQTYYETPRKITAHSPPEQLMQY